MDSTFVVGSTTNEKGKFALKGVSPDNYILVVSYIGYYTSYIGIENVSGNIDIGDIYLDEESSLLEGVTVTASNVVTRIDRQLILPTQAQIRTSKSGYELLNKLMLPGLKVNAIENTVGLTDGGGVEIRINDIPATTAQVQALRPDQVLRVEFIDNPGIRYADKGIGAVINYVVKRRESGVAGGVNLTNAVATGFGNDNLYLKANHRNSEFGVNYYISYRDYTNRYSNTSTYFVAPDGSITHRDFVGINKPFNYVDQSVEASYNYTIQDKRVVNVSFRANLYNAPNRDNAHVIKEEGKEDVFSYTKVADKNNSPVLDLYYREQLPKKQSIAVNLVGTYIQSDYYRNYQEYLIENDPLVQYAYGTDGNRYSLIGEGIYSKEFSKIKLNAGLQFTQAYTKNQYTGDVGDVTQMHTSNWYGYAELIGKYAKLNYSVGAGVSRQYLTEDNSGYEYYTFRPNLMLHYTGIPHLNVRYNFSIVPYLPSLSQLNTIRQQRSSNEYNVGNPDLTPYRSYNNRLTFSSSFPHVEVQLSGGFNYRHHPILNQVNRVEVASGEYIYEYTSENQTRALSTYGQLNLKIQLIPEYLTASVYGGVNHYNNKGRTYDHTYTSWSGGGQLELALGDFSFGGWVDTRRNNLSGEYIYHGENSAGLMLGYSYKNLQVGGGVYYPFFSYGWKAGSKLMSEYVQSYSDTYIKDNGNMIVLSLSYNFTSGRKHKAGRKTMHHSDSDSGIVK